MGHWLTWEMLRPGGPCVVGKGGLAWYHPVGAFYEKSQIQRTKVLSSPQHPVRILEAARGSMRQRKAVFLWTVMISPEDFFAHSSDLDGVFLLLVADICPLLWLLTSCCNGAFCNSYCGKLAWLLSVSYIRATNTERSSKSNFHESKDQLRVGQVALLLYNRPVPECLIQPVLTRVPPQSLLGFASLLTWRPISLVWELQRATTAS